MTGPPELDVVIVSHRDGRWLPACLASLAARSGGCRHRVVVVENGGGEADLPPQVTGAPGVEVLTTENRGFAAANNAGLERCSAPQVLFLNPDTELLDGTLQGLCAHLDAAPDIGIVAVRQVTADGELWPTIRRFPSVRRTLADALGSERWPLASSRAGERVLDPCAYERVTECDWSSGAVLLARRSALEDAGHFDERFFLYSEETDLCLRVKQAGWRVVHVPDVTFLHHAGKAGYDVKREAQMTYARLQYARKHFGTARATAYRVALVLDRALRAGLLRRGGRQGPSARAIAARGQLAVLLGRQGSPYDPPPPPPRPLLP